MRSGIDMRIEDRGAEAWEWLWDLYQDARDKLIEKHGEEFVNGHSELVVGLLQVMEQRTHTLVLEDLLDDVLKMMKGKNVELSRKWHEDETV